MKNFYILATIKSYIMKNFQYSLISVFIMIVLREKIYKESTSMKLLIVLLCLISTSAVSATEEYDITASLKVNLPATNTEGGEIIEKWGVFVKDNIFITATRNLDLIDFFMSEVSPNNKTNTPIKRISIHVKDSNQDHILYTVNAIHWNIDNGLLILHVPQYKGPYMKINQNYIKTDTNFFLFYQSHTFPENKEIIPLKIDSLSNKKLSQNHKGFFTKYFPGKTFKKTSDEEEMLKALGQPVINQNVSEIYGIVTLSGVGNYIYSLNSPAIQQSLDTAKEFMKKEDFTMTASPSDFNAETAFSLGYTLLRNPGHSMSSQLEEDPQQLISQSAETGHPLAQFIKITNYPTIKSEYNELELQDLLQEETNATFPPLLFFIAQRLSMNKEMEDKRAQTKLVKGLLEAGMYQGYIPSYLAWAIIKENQRKFKQSRKMVKKLVDTYNARSAKVFQSARECSAVFESFKKM